MNTPLTSRETDDVDELRRRLALAERELAGVQKALGVKVRLIDKLEDIIAELVHRRWGRSSEKHPGQAELSLFNEAEIAAMAAPLDEDEDTEAADDGEGSAGPKDKGGDEAEEGESKPKKKRRRRVLPDHLQRVQLVHELEGEERVGACGHELVRIGEEVSEQIGVLPARQFVIQHVKVKYACRCCHGGGVKTAPMPPAPMPGSQASPSVLAFTAVSKLSDAVPLYRQEKIWARSGVDFPRAKLARWMIESSVLLQPLYNLMQDALFEYDIVMSDDTGIQVLTENGRSPSAKSALWIRRGGAPGQAVILIDYDVSKGAAVASRLLEEAHGFLVCDAAPTFDAVLGTRNLAPVLCNDHARRKFVEATRSVSAKKRSEEWVGTKAVAFYKKLYRIEQEIKDLPPRQRHERRQREAVPIWEAMMGWAKEVQTQGVRHAKSRTALNYLIRHEEGLRRHCEDGRLPISNILSEHVAKTIALSRKNFLFAATPAGAKASAMLWSVIESARANGHNAMHYLTAVFSAVRGARTVEELEALLPWRMSVEEAAARYAAEPMPAGEPEKKQA